MTFAGDWISAGADVRCGPTLMPDPTGGARVLVADEERASMAPVWGEVEKGD
jgi:hypothetical protein